MRHGITAVSEALMAIGIIGVSVLFVLLAGNLLGYQTQQVTSGSEERVVNDLSTIINSLEHHSGDSDYWYDVQIPNYRLEINNSVITVHAGGSSYGNQIATGLNMVDTTIQDADTICVRKNTSEFLQLNPGRCSYRAP